MQKKDVVYANIVLDTNIKKNYRDYKSCGTEYNSKEEINFKNNVCLQKDVIFIRKNNEEYFKVDFTNGYLLVFINYLKSKLNNKTYILKNTPEIKGGIYINNIREYYKDSQDKETSLISLSIDNVKKRKKSYKTIEL